MQLRQARSRVIRSIQTPTTQVIPIDLKQLVDKQLWSSGPPQLDLSAKQAKGMTHVRLYLQLVQERGKRPHHWNARSTAEVLDHSHGWMVEKPLDEASEQQGWLDQSD